MPHVKGKQKTKAFHEQMVVIAGHTDIVVDIADQRTRGEIAVRVRDIRPDSGPNPEKADGLFRWAGPVVTSERVDAALRVVLQAAGVRSRVGSIQFTGFGRQIYVRRESFIA